LLTILVIGGGISSCNVIAPKQMTGTWVQLPLSASAQSALLVLQFDGDKRGTAHLLTAESDLFANGTGLPVTYKRFSGDLEIKWKNDTESFAIRDFGENQFELKGAVDDNVLMFNRLPVETPSRQLREEVFTNADFEIHFEDARDTITVLNDSLVVVYSSLRHTEQPLHELTGKELLGYQFYHLYGLPVEWYVLTGGQTNNFHRISLEGLQAGNIRGLSRNNQPLLNRLTGSWHEAVRVSTGQVADFLQDAVPETRVGDQQNELIIDSNVLRLQNLEGSEEFRFISDINGQSLICQNIQTGRWSFWKILLLNQQLFYVERYFVTGGERERIFYKRME